MMRHQLTSPALSFTDQQLICATPDQPGVSNLDAQGRPHIPIK
jgi:hypothetical protein